MSTGWIKLHRKLTEWEWYNDLPCFRLFTHLLLTANYKPSRFRGHEIDVGSKVCGLSALAEQTGLSVMQIRTAIKKLESTGEITIKKTNKFSIISICNWDSYQEDNKQVTNNQQTSNKQVTPSKEGKKVKKVKNSIIAVPDFIDPSIWKDFVQHRGGSKFTQLMANRIINQLIKWHGEGHDANEILNNTIMNGYKGIFKPKKGNGNGNRTGHTAHEKMLAGFMQTDIRQP